MQKAITIDKAKKNARETLAKMFVVTFIQKYGRISQQQFKDWLNN